MWPFKRKQPPLDQVPAMPPELNQYYLAEKRIRNGMTWLLGIATLVVTIALAFLLFFTARFVYGMVKNHFGKTTATTTTTQKGSSTVKNQTPPQTVAGSTTPSSSPATNTTTGTSTTTTTTPTEPGGHISSTTTNIPNTGPGQTVTVFLVATTAGTMAYHLATRRQKS